MQIPVQWSLINALQQRIYNNKLTMHKNLSFFVQIRAKFFPSMLHHDLHQIPTNVDQFPIITDPQVYLPTIPMGILLS